MASSNLTDNNLKLLKAVAVQVNKADINWDKVAKEADMSTSKYARDQWTVVRNKLIGDDGNGKATTGGKRKDSAAPTPAPTAKKAKTTKGKKVESKSASEEAGEDGEGAKVQSEAGHDSDEDIFD